MQAYSPDFDHITSVIDDFDANDFHPEIDNELYAGLAATAASPGALMQVSGYSFNPYYPYAPYGLYPWYNFRRPYYYPYTGYYPFAYNLY